MKIVIKGNKKKAEEVVEDNEKPRKPLKIVIKHSGNLKREAESEPKDDNGNPSKRMKIIIKKKGLKMVSSAHYITKNEQGKPLGEDAYFVADEEQTIGVADGVGGWAKRGIDSGEYARELMKNAITEVRREAKEGSAVDPKSVLDQAFSDNKLKGASTACIATHNDGVLRAINLGDSGVMVFRKGELVFKSSIQQRRFNCPFQLGNHKKCERPDRGEVMEVPVMEGDVVVMGTDGLLDNMYKSEIKEIVAAEKERSPEDMAWMIAHQAYCHSMDEYYASPFAIESALAGKEHQGGKVDDITVVVGKIIRHYDLQLHT